MNRLGEYSPIFTSPEANNCFSIITQVIIREKQESSEKFRFCLFVSNCHASMSRDAQSADHMLNESRPQSPLFFWSAPRTQDEGNEGSGDDIDAQSKSHAQSKNCRCLKQYSLAAPSLRRSIDFCE